ncbi:hypothetical protein GHV42_07110 [Xanthomonas oryzae pv. oryzicola]|nr:hypothetical protein GHV42_07110 [Xanthomonas oryzae pv. oryzicola]
MLVSAGFLTVCVVCVLRLRLWAVVREHERQLSSGEVPMGGDVLGGLKLIVREPLLRWLAFMVLFGVGVGTLLYNEQAALLRRLDADAAAATAYYSSIDLAINALALVLQLLVTRALLSRFGIAPALLIPGVPIMLGYAVLAASPLPMMIAIVQVMTRSSEFARAKPARDTLYTPVDREWRCKAGAAIDTVVYRGGDLTFVWVHKRVPAFGSSAVFGVGLLVATGMTVGAFGLLRQARKLPGERDVGTSKRVSECVRPQQCAASVCREHGRYLRSAAVAASANSPEQMHVIQGRCVCGMSRCRLASATHMTCRSH